VDNINEVLGHLRNNYLLISIAAGLFFLAKAITGYITYLHFERRFKRIEKKLDKILQK
jgi:hypothetical protein